MTLLITGASGFLGRHLLAELDHQHLRLLVLPGDPATEKLREYGEVVVGDVIRPESLAPAMAGVTSVVHLAGFVNGGNGPAERFMQINAQGTANVAQAAREADVTHLIYTSSITVYGFVRDADESAPLESTPGYPASKIEAEAALRRLLPEGATVLRLPLVIGAGDAGFMCPALEGFREMGRVILIGSGEAPWSVLAARDAARAIALCLEKSETRGQTYNVVGETITNGELLRTMGAGVGCTDELRLPYPVAWAVAALMELLGREGMTRDQVKALSQPLAMKGEHFAELGYRPRTPWRDALDRAIAFCKSVET